MNPTRSARRAAIIDAPAPARSASRRRAAAPERVGFNVNWLTFVAVIGGVALQAGAAVWWGSAVSTRVASLEKTADPALSARVTTLEKATADLATVPATLARLDERSQQQGEQLDRLVGQQETRGGLGRARPAHLRETPMSLDPHGLLAQVHPDLVKVIEAAAQAPQPFMVVYGLRTLAAEEAAVASGHSQTLHSRHLGDARYGGNAMAVDIACLVDGAISWAVADAAGGIYGAAAAQILAAAQANGVRVQWGGQAVGAWVDGVVSHFRDWGHFQLDPSAYPS